MAYTISEKAIRFRYRNYDPDRAQKLISCPCPDICRHATFHPNPCTRFWVILLIDRQTNKHGQKHVPPVLSEVKICEFFYWACWFIGLSMISVEQVCRALDTYSTCREIRQHESMKSSSIQWLTFLSVATLKLMLICKRYHTRCCFSFLLFLNDKCHYHFSCILSVLVAFGSFRY